MKEYPFKKKKRKKIHFLKILQEPPPRSHKLMGKFESLITV